MTLTGPINIVSLTWGAMKLLTTSPWKHKSQKVALVAGVALSTFLNHVVKNINLKDCDKQFTKIALLTYVGNGFTTTLPLLTRACTLLRITRIANLTLPRALTHAPGTFFDSFLAMNCFWQLVRMEQQTPGAIKNSFQKIQQFTSWIFTCFSQTTLQKT